MGKRAVSVGALVAVVVPTQPYLVCEALASHVPLLAASEADEATTSAHCVRIFIDEGGYGACVHRHVYFFMTHPLQSRSVSGSMYVSCSWLDHSLILYF